MQEVPIMTMPRFRLALRLSVFQRIALAFVCILSLLVLLAGGAALGLGRFVEKLSTSQAISGDVRVVNRIDQEMAALQRRVREYLASGKPEALTEIETAYQGVKQN